MFARPTRIPALGLLAALVLTLLGPALAGRPCCGSCGQDSLLVSAEIKLAAGRTCCCAAAGRTCRLAGAVPAQKSDQAVTASAQIERFHQVESPTGQPVQPELLAGGLDRPEQLLSPKPRAPAYLANLTLRR